MPASPKKLRFGVFEADLETGELRKSGIRIKLQEKPFRILALLLDRRGETVTREELRENLWHAGTFVDYDGSLGTAMGKLRQALGDSAENPRFIETITGRGYRFLVPVRAISPVDPALAPLNEPRPSIRRYGPSAAITVLVGVMAIGLLAWRGPHPASPVLIKSVLVLPLENLSGAPQQEYFVDGMTDELITDMAKLGSMRVISRTSAVRLKKNGRPLAQIARELNVDDVVEGSVVRSGNRVRITAQLIDAAADRHLWAESYDRELSDVLLRCRAK
jgi:TolB-like protein/DNA-binding winged helix-turn-helix (wHTH) protein